ncbi:MULTISPECIES: aspartate/glutamate racemase family protein [unclassified Paracoccus (in: a-proteobacteria)]|uniref:aspartate/glutamate racemase family protein n=1 Tax=unclassified Paracoccus (in: a-proteobacteria) TaxID=2688777 RepID=UPI001FFE0F58|nr:MULTISPECIES: aspartate/glutamate racemase family protein [unclassified Paracoccus (in: a-proteobacteria)]
MPSFRFSTLRPIQRLLPALGLFTALMVSPAVAETRGNTILLINPNSNQTATQSMTELAAEAAGEAVTVLGKSNNQAPALLTTPQDMIDAVSGVVAIGQAAAEDPAIGAIIIAAFSDPGLEELRNAVDLPVFGIGEEVFHEAARDGRAFSIVTVTPNEDLIESFRQKAASLGYEAQYRGTRVTEGDPNELVQSPEKLDAALAKVVQVAVEQDNAQAVIMGGGPLSASALRLQPDFQVPLVVAVNAAARAAAAAIAAQD